jgi:hypothetical protein
MEGVIRGRGLLEEGGCWGVIRGRGLLDGGDY